MFMIVVKDYGGSSRFFYLWKFELKLSILKNYYDLFGESKVK